MDIDSLISKIQGQLRLVDSEKLLFHTNFPIEKHISKKNNRPTRRGRRSQKTGKRTLFPGKSTDLKYFETYIRLKLDRAMIEQGIKEPFTDKIHAVFHFHYGGSYARYSDTSDLSNKYEIYQDCMEDVGLIKNDKLIKSHDGSRIFKNDETFFECFLLRFDEKTDLRSKK